jgi:hypothetical protein
MVHKYYRTIYDWLVVSNMVFIFHFIYGMSSFPLMNSMIFQRGRSTTNQKTSRIVLFGNTAIEWFIDYFDPKESQSPKSHMVCRWVPFWPLKNRLDLRALAALGVLDNRSCQQPVFTCLFLGSAALELSPMNGISHRWNLKIGVSTILIQTQMAAQLLVTQYLHV